MSSTGPQVRKSAGPHFTDALIHTLMEVWVRDRVSGRVRVSIGVRRDTRRQSTQFVLIDNSGILARLGLGHVVRFQVQVQ